MVLCSKSRAGKTHPGSYISPSISPSNQFTSPTPISFPTPASIERSFARRGGVDVSSAPPEKRLAIVQHASRYLYKRYLRHGIRVYEYRRSVLHAKTAVIDGIWSTVGSSNIDRRSFSRNLEINAILLDQPFGDEMERVFFADLRKSEELLLQNWKKRSVWNFLLEWFFYRFRNLF